MRQNGIGYAADNLITSRIFGIGRSKFGHLVLLRFVPRKHDGGTCRSGIGQHRGYVLKRIYLVATHAVQIVSRHGKLVVQKHFQLGCRRQQVFPFGLHLREVGA